MVGQLFVPPLFPFLHGAGCKVPLARAFSVAVNFLRCLMPSDRHDLAVTRSKLCEACGTRLAQSVRRAMRQSGLVAPLAEPVAKAVHRERPAKFCDEIGVLAKRRRGIDDPLQLWKDGYFESDWLTLSILGLSKLKPAIMRHLITEANHVGAPLSGE